MRKENINSIPEEATATISAGHLLHPAKHFDHPRDVLAADGIGKEEKRAILASWASDIFAIESVPALRLYPGTDEAVSYDEIIKALKTLDKDDQQSGEQGSPSSFNVHGTRRRRPQVRRFGGLGLCSYRKGERRRQPFEI
ncbi:hypothetical protein PH547_29505 [Rhizobium sp. CNPSo 3464]|uniref:hypothetical protein n=1 Tax=Rhizobium sp. CNPSo 3464 TaxID=3021406 RepID=UPI00254B5380|nr:hypothetical protein [Rhizobium sp. CNPSo 3464]MDK4743028.1 hypothetical protein [Rhizobium sp. CNPSo 3464]